MKTKLKMAKRKETVQNESGCCDCGSTCSCKNCACGPQAKLFDALGSETRLYIINLLRKKPLAVSEIVEKTELDQTLVSHSLKQLEEAGLVKSQREGKFKIYSANKVVEPIMSLIDEQVKANKTSSRKSCCCA